MSLARNGLLCLAALLPLQDSAGPMRSPEPLLARVAVVGASVSDGFQLDLDLADVLHETVAGPHEEPVSSTSAYFFLNPMQVGPQQLEEVLEAEPTLVLAMDFLFWFGYGVIDAEGGTLTEESERLVLLERGLKLLDEVEVPLVLGDFPDMSEAVGKMLLEAQVPTAEMRAALNRRLAEWAAERPRAIVLPLSSVVEELRSDRVFTIGRYRWPEESSDRVLQGDRLHPTVEGLAAIGHLIAFELEARGWTPGEDVDLDLRAVLTRLGEELDEDELTCVREELPVPVTGR